MSDDGRTGVLYTDHAPLAAATPIASLWSFATRSREPGRRSVGVRADGSREYWLDRSDPLLNTILPGTHVSLILNFGDRWAAGRSLTTSALLPRACVVGPVTRARILRVARSVSAVGAVIPPALTSAVLGVPASELVDRIVSLDELMNPGDAECLIASLADVDEQRRPAVLRDTLLRGFARGSSAVDPLGRSAPRIIRLQSGRVSIDDLARMHGLGRRQFRRRFDAATGLPPKLFARITRFQALVQALLSTDVSRWASAASAVGFYDQAHMINEFRAFAGSPPTVFFQPHGDVGPSRVRLRGRPSEWLRG